MKLRPYQNECVEAVLRGFSKLDRLLISVPTGGGKTIIAADLIDGWTEGQKMGLGDKVLFLAHRDELIEQGKDKIETYTG
jgi:superfamily II DNA or RNA helicase